MDISYVFAMRAGRRRTMNLEKAQDLIRATGEMTGIEIALGTVIRHLETRLAELEQRAAMLEYRLPDQERAR